MSSNLPIPQTNIVISLGKKEESDKEKNKLSHN